MTDREKRQQYNRAYYEAHREEILASRKMAGSRPYKNTDAHRKAARAYYHRKVANETPEERAQRNAERRRKYLEKKNEANKQNDL